VLNDCVVSVRERACVRFAYRYTSTIRYVNIDREYKIPIQNNRLVYGSPEAGLD